MIRRNGMQRLFTTAGEKLSGIPWNTYPRPRMVREKWLCLNGEWSFSVGGEDSVIRVPFCPESLLSGLAREMEYGQEMTYRRAFELPEDWNGLRILLHLGAVSRVSEVRINGKTAVTGQECYFPLSADITELLRPGSNEMTVICFHDLSHQHLWGKQKKKRGGMWYTPVSGIWQTVWLEAVPEKYIRNLEIRTGENYAEIRAEGIGEGTVTLEGRDYPLTDGSVRIEIPEPELWSPDHPRLYRFTVTGGEDRVESYFALRTLSVKRIGGKPRLCLNGKPYFFHGLLDQGYWSDGIYTPAEAAEYERDILAMKALGFNTLRKHIKIEPEQFYYDCDRLGMIVFQDMVNCGEYRFLQDTLLPTLLFRKKSDRRMHRDPETRRNFLHGMEETVRLLRNHPCICLWTIFNEGWGQFCADEAYERLKAMDPERFIDSTSGWFHQKKSDVDSIHDYYLNVRIGKRNLPQLLSEFGGWSFKIPEHSYNLDKTYGYKKYADHATFVNHLRAHYLKQILPQIRSKGLCGAIYTQLSDVEDETNGLLTYDRKKAKIAPEDFLDVSERLVSELQGD
jgi:beta-galactosidase/beta-glucuronidase